MAIAIAGAAAMQAQTCVTCHEDSAKKFATSVHSPLDCTNCHADITGPGPHDPAPKKVDCATCHADAATAQTMGIHAKAANCLSCHGAPHEILPSSDPQSKTYRTNVPRTCGTCHLQKFVMESSGLSAQPIFSYAESVHGRAVAKGSLKAAICTDCHGHHDIQSPRDQHSPINKFNIPNTCGNCHGAIRDEFMKSIHGKAILKGNSQAPVCTECHGIHNIKPHIDPKSSVASQQIARTTCGQCHGGVKLTQELGVPGGRVTTYQDSYHGLAKRLGSEVAANCASCHGVHNILPSSDPKSSTNKANLAHTCGKCHPGASAKFTQGKVHLEAAPIGNETGEILIRWIRRVYIFLILATIGFMLFHNALSWWKKAVAARRDPNRVIVRMNLNQRIQHFILLTSFIVLVISGFALAWPESPLAWLLGADENIRRIVHRIAAVVMLGLGAYHVAYMIGTREGRKGLRDFWFRWKDPLDLIGNLKYYAGLSKTKPMIARFGYAEKLEYWAMIWGTIVMGVTGLMLWMKVDVSRLLPRWWVDVALAIHFYEAVLATLAVIVWHFYHVMFDPDVYPMSWTCVDGKVTPEEYRHEHGLAYEEWKKEHGGESTSTLEKE
jgi:cytochrome b subunit of formate dehydrogenase